MSAESDKSLSHAKAEKLVRQHGHRRAVEIAKSEERQARRILGSEDQRFWVDVVLEIAEDRHRTARQERLAVPKAAAWR